MRILCDNCSAKYSIADEKVVGKVFKIRCKKCSHVILVRGDESSGPGEPAGQASSQGGVWYVVRAGQQDGPYTEADVHALLASGEVQADTYTWREGFADWIPLSSVDELRHLVAGHAEPAPAHAATNGVADASGRDEFDDVDSTRVVAGPSYTSTPSYEAPSYDPPSYDPPSYDAPSYDPASLAAAGESTEAMDVASFTARQAAATAPDPTEAMSVPRVSAPSAAAPVLAASPEPGGMFASFEPPSQGPGIGFDPSASFDGGLEAIVPQAPKPKKKQANGLVGARNEDSVLFSLNRLSDVAAGADATEAPANSEASGLIDIRALSASAAAVSGGREGRADGDPFSVPAAGPAIQVPAMMPMGTRKSNAPLFLMLGAGMLLLLIVGSALIAVVVWRTGEPDPIIKERPDAVAAVDPKAGAPVVPGDPAQPKTDSEAPAAGGDAEKKDEPVADGAAGADDAADKAGEPVEGADDGAKDEAADKGDAEDDKATPKEPEKPKTAEELRKEKERRDELAEKRKKEKELAALNKKDDPPVEKKDKKDDKADKADKGKGSDSIDDIIGDIGKKPKDKKDPPKEEVKKDPPKEAPAAKELSKSDVLQVIRRSYGRISACSNNQPDAAGTVMVKFTITSSGSVASAQVTGGPHKSSAVGGCITRVVRGMQFPASSKGLTINYPFQLK